MDIVDHIVNTTGLSRSQALAATDGMIEAVCESLARGESVYLRGFATIKAVTRKARKARNITKGTEVTIPEHRSAKLVVCSRLIDRMNEATIDF